LKPFIAFFFFITVNYLWGIDGDNKLVEYNVKTTISGFPNDVGIIFQLAKPENDRKYFDNVISHLGLTGKAAVDSVFINLKAEGAYYSLNIESGMENYSNLPAAKWDKLEAPIVPSEEKSKETAKDFLKKLSYINVSKNDLPKATMVNETRRSAADIYGNQKVEPQLFSRTVVFTKYCNGIPVFAGPGSEITITIGNDGAILSFQVNWFPVIEREGREVKVFSADDVLREFP
jgi:hypothetical protein